MTAAMGNILRRSVSRTSKRKSPGSRPGARVESVKRRKHGKPKTAGSATGKPHPPDRKPKPAHAASRLPQRTADETLFEADFWRDLSSKMQALANEEKKILGAIREDRCLLVYCEYNADITDDESELIRKKLFCLLYRLESGRWDLTEGPNDSFKARFVALASRAGKQLGRKQLGPPKGIKAADFFLHSLCLHLRKMRRLRFASDTNAIIVNLCQASATFFSWLENEAVETSADESIQAPVEPIPTELSERLRRGKRCDQILKEMRRIKYWRLDAVKTMAEIQTEHPDLAVWKLREGLGLEDREFFDRPNRWESVVTYGLGLLGKEYGRKPATVNDWVKEFRHHQKEKGGPDYGQ
jgi:hypothetical protein